MIIKIKMSTKFDTKLLNKLENNMLLNAHAVIQSKITFRVKLTVSND